MSETRKRTVVSHRDLEIWQRGRALAQRVYDLTKRFPREECYSLTDQVRRSSRSVTANISEAWQKRRYEAAFVSKLTDSAAEAAETQDWLLHALDCQYLSQPQVDAVVSEYEAVLKTLHSMMFYASRWCAPASNHKPQATNHIE